MTKMTEMVKITMKTMYCQTQRNVYCLDLLIFWHAFSTYSPNVTTVNMVLHSRFLTKCSFCNYMYNDNSARIRSVPFFHPERAVTEAA